MPFTPSWPTARPFPFSDLRTALDALVSFVNGVESSAAAAGASASSAQSSASSAVTTANNAQTAASAAQAAAVDVPNLRTQVDDHETRLDTLEGAVGAKVHAVLCVGGVWGQPSSTASVNLFVGRPGDPDPPSASLTVTPSVVLRQP